MERPEAEATELPTVCSLALADAPRTFPSLPPRVLGHEALAALPVVDEALAALLVVDEAFTAFPVVRDF